MSQAEDEERKRRREAADLNDRIRVQAPPGFDSTSIIRYWRDHRYGPEWWKKRKADRSR